MKFELRPIGWIRKTKTKTRIVLYKKFQTGLAGVENKTEIWMLWWFHRNDNRRMRSTLKVHPREIQRIRSPACLRPGRRCDLT